MPVYTITHSAPLTDVLKADMAQQISDAHCTICSADPKYVNVRFMKIGANDGYTAGQGMRSIGSRSARLTLTHTQSIAPFSISRPRSERVDLRKLRKNCSGD